MAISIESSTSARLSEKVETVVMPDPNGVSGDLIHSTDDSEYADRSARKRGSFLADASKNHLGARKRGHFLDDATKNHITARNKGHFLADVTKNHITARKWG